MISTKAPKYLKASTRRWFESVQRDFEMDEHHQKLLTLAATAWDRAEDARVAIAKHGLTFEDRFGSPRARPEVGIARDCMVVFSRLLREIGLDAAEVSTPRPYALPANDGRKSRRAS